MWLLILLLAVSIVITAVVRRRGRDTRDSVDDQRKQLEALRAATTGSNAPPDEMGGGPSGPRSVSRSRERIHISGRALLVAVGVVVAGVALYAIAAGWDSGSADSGSGNAGSESPRKSTTTTSSSTTTTTTTPPAVAITGNDGGTVTISVPAGPVRLGITARQSCWVQVERADGTEVETTTLGEGDTRAYEEAGPLTVRLGNPGGVDVAINDQPLTLPPSEGNAMELQITPVG